MALWKSLKHKALLARQLTFLDWLALVEAWWAMLAFYLSVRWMSYERLNTSVHPVEKEADVSSDAVALALRLRRLADWASRFHLLSMTCLVKSFTLRWMLGRRGIPSQLRIGAHKTLAGLHAHAWVEVNGQAIGESEELPKRFKPLKNA
jgi:hypothetical protein